MEFRILGPLEVLEGGRPVPLGGRRQRAALAILLLNANEVVSSDRLMDELWNGTPPPSAAKAVQNNIVRLRKVLGDRVVTRAPGYLVRVEPGELDSTRFEGLAEQARGAGPAVAAELLREALALWRGPPLADLAYEEFVQTESGRLEELRLAALDDRIEADLELGRHAALVGELEALAAAHPFRERPRAQLMLALYRSGRQAEALEIYRSTRRTLVDELGLEPGQPLQELQRRILAHDPALGLPEGEREEQTGSFRPPRRRSRRVGIAVVMATGVAVAALLISRGGSSVAVSANSVAVIDPAHDRVVADIPVGARPAYVAAGEGAIWVANLDDATVSRLDPASRSVDRTIAVSEPATGLAVGAGSVWVASASGALRRIDPSFDAVVQTIKARSDARYGFEIDPSLNSASPVAAGSGEVWLGHSTTVTRIDPGAGQAVGAVGVDVAPSAIAVGLGAVWVADAVDDNLTRIDPNGTTTTIAVGRGPRAVATGAGAIWVADSQDDAVVKVDPATSAVVTTIPVGGFPTGVTVGDGAVWVANSRSGTVSRIDPRTSRVVRTIRLGEGPDAITVADGRVWVSVKARAPSPSPLAAGGRAILDVPADLDSIDPALAGDPAAVQLEYATCAKLLTYPDRPAPLGWELTPEVAASLPAVAADGRTYTFTVRPGFRFSPPSNEPVTAETFRHVLERDLSPGVRSQAAAFLRDIAGARAYEAGRARHIAGVSVRGDRLTIRLVAPAPDLPARIASPYLCAVPTNTPLAPQPRQPIPSAGPYYIASYVPGERLVLRHNPNYDGPRPRRLAEVDYTLGVDPSRTVTAIETGKADYAISSFITSAVPWRQIPALASRYGPASPAAKAGHQQFFENPLGGGQWIALNANRPLFRNARRRRAVAYALDRPALARDHQYTFHPDDHFLMPGMPGYEPVEPFPLRGPDLETARRLAGRRRAIAIDYSCNGCSDDVLVSQLAKIGIDVVVKQFPVSEMLRRVKTPGESVDIFGGGGGGFDYADPVELLNHVFVGQTVGAFALHDPVRLGQLEMANRLSGPARARAFGQLDVQLARDARLIPLGWSTSYDFFSTRIGCQVFQPVYGIDLGALCMRNARPLGAAAQEVTRSKH